MEPKINRVVIEYGLPHSEMVKHEITTEEPISYRVNDVTTPGCFRVWYGRKTFIVPLANTGLIELDL